MESLLGNSRRPDVTFYRCGRIDITSRVARSLRLEEGDVIDIGVHDNEYYIYIKAKASNIVGNHGARCFPSKKSSRNFRTYSKKLCSAILNMCGSNVARLPAGEVESIPYIGEAMPLIIRLNLE